MSNNKIFNEISIKKFIKRFNKKKIVLCHGVFDILHFGHLKYFEAAKKFGDLLIVSITKDNYVTKGFQRPFFSEKKRLEMISSLTIVDGVILSNSENSVKIINIIKPNYYAKGIEYKKTSNDLSRNIILEKKAVKKNKGEIIFVDEEVHSSSKLINVYGEVLDSAQEEFIKKIKKKYGIIKILNFLNSLKNQKSLVIGEAIIDKYISVSALGKSGKEPYLAFLKNNEKLYLGGSLAIARQIAEISKDVNLISYLGDKNNFKNFINDNLPKNLKKNFFFKKNSPTILKTRFIDVVTGKKIFGTYDMNDDNFLKKEYLKCYNLYNKIAKKVDNIVIADYGHGLVNTWLSKKLCFYNKKISLNSQINAANVGYHNLRKYKNISNIIINEAELRYEFRDRKTPLPDLAKILLRYVKAKNIVITTGSTGSLLLNKNNKIFTCPAFSKNVLDKVGAGDSMLSILSLCFAKKIPEDVSLFFGNILGSISVGMMANEKSISFLQIYNTIKNILK